VDKLLLNWKTTILGVLAIIIAVVPPLRDWVTATSHIDFSAILALIVGVMGAVQKDA